MATALPTTTTAISDSAAGGRTGVAAQAILAMLLGVLIVGVAGFSHLDVVHNAAHDTRHSNGFPCH